jgi:hypothetical protein
MKLLYIFFLSTISCFSQTQEATIFFNDGESIDGFGNLKRNKIKFRISLDEKADLWDYEMISKIEFHGFEISRTFKYLRVKENTNPILIELISEGEVSLYQEKLTYWSSINTHTSPSDYGKTPSKIPIKTSKIKNYIMRNNDEFPTCLNCGIFSNWKKNIISYLSDCPTLIEKIKKNEFREIHLQEIIEYYNDFCTDI